MITIYKYYTTQIITKVNYNKLIFNFTTKTKIKRIPLIGLR